MARRVFALIDSGALRVAAPDGAAFIDTDAGDFKFRSGDEVVVFVPGMDVAHHLVSLPTKSDREARQAAPFTIEDDVAVPVETLHVALGPEGTGQRTLLTCNPASMEQWQSVLAAHGLSEAILTPDYLALGEHPAAIDLGDRILVHSDDARFTLAANAPEELRSAILRQVGVAGDVAIGSGGSPVQGLAGLAQSVPTFLDLNQGKFARRRTTGLSDLSGWKRPIALAAVAGLAWIAMLGLEAHQKSEAAEAMRAEAQRIYADRFPAESGVTNPATRVQQKLRERTAASLDFQQASAVLFDALERVDGASLRSLRFESGDGRLRAGLEYANYGDDLKLAELLNQSGLAASLGDSRANGGVVTGDLTLEGPR